MVKPKENIVGKKYDYFTVVQQTDDYITHTGVHYTMYICKCDCGRYYYAHGHEIRSGKRISCGCKSGRLFKGNKIGDLQIERIFSKNHKRHYECKCKCGNTVIYSREQMYRYKSCEFCNKSDGISYGEKFIMGMLNQLHVNYIYQYSKNKNCEWDIGDYRYDFYLSDYNSILEINGDQHYREVKSWGVTSDKQSENDKVKKDKILKFVDNYITIDCRTSKCEFIKNSILSSPLSSLIDLSKVDFDACNEYAQKNILKEICEKWENSNISIMELTAQYGLCRSAIRKYLKRGTEVGYCHYSVEETKRRSFATKRIIVKRDKDIVIYPSLKALCNLSEKVYGEKFVYGTARAAILYNNGNYKNKYSITYLDCA